MSIGSLLVGDPQRTSWISALKEGVWKGKVE